MDIVILTNEYPPNVYGGAGVHVEYLTEAMSGLGGPDDHVEVLCFGDQDVDRDSLTVRGVEVPAELPVQDERHRKLMNTLVRDLVMAGSVSEADVVHCHTWYTHLAGCLTRQLTGGKLVLTTHSLEPHRPWKAEQLGTGYQVSSWVERTAFENADGVVAVSGAMAEDVQDLYDVDPGRIEVIFNGIDLDQYRPRPDRSVLEKYGVDPDEPFVLFVGRITRQKGILHLVNAIPELEEGTQIVLCAGAPDTEEIEHEMSERVEAARAAGDHEIVWIPEMLPKDDIITIYSHAAVFVCPSVYEPFGIINLEAMACRTPVVAAAVGGIPEVVVDGETGYLVPFESVEGEAADPKDPDAYSRSLAEPINRLMGDPDLRERMAENARERVETTFSWEQIARETLAFYRRVIEE